MGQSHCFSCFILSLACQLSWEKRCFKLENNAKFHLLACLSEVISKLCGNKLFLGKTERIKNIAHTHPPVPPRTQVHFAHDCWDGTKDQVEVSDSLFPSEAWYALFTFPPLLMTGGKISRYKTYSGWPTTKRNNTLPDALYHSLVFFF